MEKYCLSFNLVSYCIHMDGVDIISNHHRYSLCGVWFSFPILLKCADRIHQVCLYSHEFVQKPRKNETLLFLTFTFCCFGALLFLLFSFFFAPFFGVVTVLFLDFHVYHALRATDSDKGRLLALLSSSHDASNTSSIADFLHLI